MTLTDTKWLNPYADSANPVGTYQAYALLDEGAGVAAKGASLTTQLTKAPARWAIGREAAICELEHRFEHRLGVYAAGLTRTQNEPQDCGLFTVGNAAEGLVDREDPGLTAPACDEPYDSHEEVPPCEDVGDVGEHVGEPGVVGAGQDAGAVEEPVRGERDQYELPKRRRGLVSDIPQVTLLCYGFFALPSLAHVALVAKCGLGVRGRQG